MTNIVEFTPVFFISGPMTGIYEFNFPAFDARAAELRAGGWHVYNPAERDREDQGFCEDGCMGCVEECEQQGFNRRLALANCLRFIAEEATHMWMLPGWAKSKGARAEYEAALALDLIFHGAAA